MRRITTTLLLVGIAAVWALPAHSQAKRLDYVWARQTTNPITLDGVLNEADWSKADSLFLKFGIDNGVPGSGTNDANDGYGKGDDLYFSFGGN